MPATVPAAHSHQATAAIHRRATRIEIRVGLALATVLGLLATLPRIDWHRLDQIGRAALAAHRTDTAAATDITMPAVAVLLGIIAVVAVAVANRGAGR